MTPRVARVVLDTPLPQLDHVYDYAVPEALQAVIQVGMRVRVPLQRSGRVTQGWVIGLAESSEFTGKLSPVSALLTNTSVLPEHVYRLARTVADRSAGVVSDVIRLAVPARHATAEKAFLAALAEAAAGSAPESTPTHASSFPSHTRRAYRVAEPGVLSTELGPVPRWAARLAEEAAREFTSGRSVVIATPDYRDQHFLERALEVAGMAEHVVRVDARLSPKERFANHLRLISGVPAIAIGNRSVLYAPVAEAAHLMVWNDSDPSFVEQLSPGAHARDVALQRSTLFETSLTLSSFAPSTEVQRLLDLNWLELDSPDRPVKPKVQVAEAAQMSGMTSAAFLQSKEAIKHGPVLLQVAQPGFSTGAMCRSCHTRATCPQCGGSVFFPNKNAPARCRSCGATPFDWKCRQCSLNEMAPVGAAASRTAEQLVKAFPGVPIVIADGEHQVLEVGSAPALVIATRGAEPVADGGYRAVVLLDGARLLAREGLRVTEDAIRLWTGAAALASSDGVVLMTDVTGPLAAAFANWSFTELVRQELRDRAALKLPPAARIASLTCQSSVMPEVLKTVNDELVASKAAHVFGPLEVERNTERLVVQFDYARTESVATVLKALAVRLAATPRKAFETERAERPRATVRIRFDDPEVF